MKKLIFFITILITSSLYAQWEWQNPVPQGNDLNDVQFFNNQEGWAVGDYGTILHSVDGGVTWVDQQSGITEDLHSIFIDDIGTLWSVGSSGVIIKSEDGGINWIQKSSNTELDLFSLTFIDSNNGWCIAKKNDEWDVNVELLKTTDGGQNWNTIYEVSTWEDTTLMLYSIQFLNDSIGWGCGWVSIDSMPTQQVIVKSNDGGNSWLYNPNWIFQTAGCGLYDIFFSDSNHGWAVGGCQTGEIIYYTHNGGENWEVQYSDYISLLSVHFENNSIGWATGRTPWTGCSSAPVIVRTTNGGALWTKTDFFGIYEFCRSYFNNINFSTISDGWVVGKFGRIHHTTNGGLTWESQCEEATHIPLKDVCFTDSLYGWAVGWSYYPDGSSPVVMHTQDGGIVWEDLLGNIKTDYVDFSFRGVSFSDHFNGWIVGEHPYDGGVIINTNDGGNNWELQNNDPYREYSSVCFIDQEVGWVAGSYGRILSTTNGGNEWVIQNSGTDNYLRDLFFTDQNYGWAVGNNGTTIYTEDGGLSWISQISGTSEKLLSVHFCDSENGGAVGENGTILLTTNGGISWELQNSGQISDLDDIFMTAPDIAWAVGSDYIDPFYYSLILNTVDGGSTWESQTHPSALDRSLKSVWFTDQNKGWVVGTEGTILHTDKGGTVGIRERFYTDKDIINLKSFPNPFNDKITIEFESLKKGECSLSIVSLSGTEVESIFSGIIEKGNYKMNWDSNNGSSGIYFVKIKTDTRIFTQKIIKK